MEVIKFHASWCGPCKMMAPHFEQVKAEMPDIKFSEVDIENDKDGLAVKHGVMSIPTMIIIKDGKVVAKSTGFIPASQISHLINEQI